MCARWNAKRIVQTNYKLGANYLDGSSETLWQDLREQSTFLFSVIYLLGALCRHLKNRFLQATYWQKCQKNLSLRAMACLTWSDSRYLETRMTNAIWWKHWGWQWIIFELMRFYESFTYFAYECGFKRFSKLAAIYFPLGLAICINMPTSKTWLFLMSGKVLWIIRIIVENIRFHDSFTNSILKCG